MKYVLSIGLLFSVLTFLFMLGWAGSVTALVEALLEGKALVFWCVVFLPWVGLGVYLIQGPRRTGKSTMGNIEED